MVDTQEKIPALTEEEIKEAELIYKGYIPHENAGEGMDKSYFDSVMKITKNPFARKEGENLWKKYSKGDKMYFENFILAYTEIFGSLSEEKKLLYTLASFSEEEIVEDFDFDIDFDQIFNFLLFGKYPEGAENLSQEKKDELEAMLLYVAYLDPQTCPKKRPLDELGIPTKLKIPSRNFKILHEREPTF